jgi:DNA (cytosine-5)-methyltransferase 1
MIPAYGIPGNWIGRAPENGGNAVEPMLDVSPCQTTTDRHGVAYSVHGTQDPDIRNDQAHTLGRNSGQENAVLQVVGALACNTGPNGHDAGNFACNQAVDAGHVIQTNMAVRRLTPTECERLQGFPDGWTNVPHRGKPSADGPRYKALGNSFAVPVVRWIGERIQAMENHNI